MPSAPTRKRKKVQKESVRLGSDAFSPTLKEWSTMQPFGSFLVEDADGNYNKFTLGDRATILPGGIKVGKPLDLHRFWVVKILAIRGRPCVGSAPRKTAKAKMKGCLPQIDQLTASSNPFQLQDPDVWVKIRWYYSPKEVSYRIPGFTDSHCSKYERIYSDHSEVVSARTFNEVVSVAKFREDDPDQAFIDNDDFFTRYFLKTSSKRFEIESYSLKTSTHLSDSVGCICGGPYNIKNKASLQVMYMCPRPHCRRFYHSACLLQSGHWTQMTHPLIRLSCSPDTDELPVLLSCPSIRQHPKSDSVGCFGPVPEAIDEFDPQLPENLLKLAAQPIVRGAALHALGFAGNSRAVVSARRFVYAAIQKGVSVPDGWENNLGLDLDAAMVEASLPALKLADTGDPLVLMCPNCSGPI
ncbi:hypothetical protein FB451DRAFT_136965 [Mycena latifolia]|nr:hypothetical protein FB451DRAFT_136965 [Mycena latifolia]